MRLPAFVLSLLVAAPVLAQVQSVDNLYVGDGLVYFNLRDGVVVSEDEKTATNWDILINGVEVHPNRAGMLMEIPFDDLSEAPLEGMGRGQLKTVRGDAWYNYDMNTHIVTPVQDMTFIIMLADDSYAKLEILGYYHRVTEDPRYMSFRYQIAPDKGRVFADSGK